MNDIDDDEPVESPPRRFWNRGRLLRLLVIGLASFAAIAFLTPKPSSNTNAIFSKIGSAAK